MTKKALDPNSVISLIAKCVEAETDEKDKEACDHITFLDNAHPMAEIFSDFEDTLRDLFTQNRDNILKRPYITAFILTQFPNHYDINEMLYYAAIYGSAKSCALICEEEGVNVNQLNPEGCSLLHIAAFQDDGELCKILKKHGIKTDIVAKSGEYAGCTALDIAIKNENKKFCKAFDPKEFSEDNSPATTVKSSGKTANSLRQRKPEQAH